MTNDSAADIPQGAIAGYINHCIESIFTAAEQAGLKKENISLSRNVTHELSRYTHLNSDKQEKFNKTYKALSPLEHEIINQAQKNGTPITDYCRPPIPDTLAPLFEGIDASIDPMSAINNKRPPLERQPWFECRAECAII